MFEIIQENKKELDGQLEDLMDKEKKIFDKKKHSRLVLDFAETMDRVYR